MKISPLITIAGLISLAFTLATGLAPRAEKWGQRGKSDNLFGMMFGDARKLFANQFFTMADVYFHSGYYPSVFDQNAQQQKEIIAASRGEKESEEDEMKEDFLGQPRDWIDRFGRHFKITAHTHLDNHHEREILPWLRLAADLDPQKIETYTVGAFFLREHLARPAEAESFLREGLRHNPGNHELLFELGRIYEETLHDHVRARNVWELGVQKVAGLKPRSDDEIREQNLAYDKLAVHLAHLEEGVGRYPESIAWLRAAQKVSPAPQGLQNQIDELQKKIAAQP
jgi:tetratricopeptide (TPR) repeat protein